MKNIKLALPGLLLLAILAFLSSGSTSPTVAFHGPPGEHIVAVGPVDPQTAVPKWYQDSTGRRVQVCLTPVDGALCISDPPIPGNAWSERTQYGSEAFYWAADAGMTTGNGGRALLVLAWEIAYLNEDPVPGEVIVFGRIRFKL